VLRLPEGGSGKLSILALVKEILFSLITKIDLKSWG
jgi:hypothetical protein